ncbi:MAG: methyltransferase [Chloroflexi bacterium]|nr:methyltransferase [Chloroflexota bacterium]
MRVIAGSAKGRPLVSPRGVEIRPTTDKVKGAIFSMLEARAFQRIDDGGHGGPFPFANMLDLFSGTGALGIEGLSRGAEHVDFVESNSRARNSIQVNLARTGFVEKSKIFALDASRAVSIFRGHYDLILADPPYGDPVVPSLIETLGGSRILARGALVVIELLRKNPFPDSAGALHLARARYHGETAILLYEASTD